MANYGELWRIMAKVFMANRAQHNCAIRHFAIIRHWYPPLSTLISIFNKYNSKKLKVDYGILLSGGVGVKKSQKIDYVICERPQCKQEVSNNKVLF